MKYLKNKNSRRRGIAMELAIFTILICFGLSIIIVTTSIIQKNNYNKVYYEYTEKLELERIGGEFCSAVKSNNLTYFKWKLEEEHFDEYAYEIASGDIKVLTVSEKGDDGKVVFIVELTPIIEDDVVVNYKITKWELKK